MSLIIDNNCFSFSGGTFVRARNNHVEIIRDTISYKVDAKEKVQWIKVSPDGKTVFLYAMNGTLITRWRDDRGDDVFAFDPARREIFGCGFIVIKDEVVTLFYKSGLLQGFTSTGKEIFSCNLKSPQFFRSTSFVNISDDRIAVLGSYSGDFAYVFVNVQISELLNDTNAVQGAIRSESPLWDRATTLAVGPAGSNSFCAFRDPQDEEIPLDEEDEEDLRDVGNFSGVYIREISTGKLIERHSYQGKLFSGTPIMANEKCIVVQVAGGVDVIDRLSGNVRAIPAAILDVAGKKLVVIDDENIGEIIPIDALR